MSTGIQAPTNAKVVFLLRGWLGGGLFAGHMFASPSRVSKPLDSISGLFAPALDTLMLITRRFGHWLLAHNRLADLSCPSSWTSPASGPYG